MESKESKFKSFFKRPFTFKEVIIASAIVILTLYLIKLVFKASLFFLVKFIIPVFLLIWLVSMFLDLREQNDKEG